MFFELIAAIVAAFAGAGLALAANRLSGGRLPRWAMPVAAGVAMLAFAVWSEYTWFSRTAASLPPSLQIVRENEVRALYRPWSYAVPLVNRFAALDLASLRSTEAAPEQRLADLYFFGRWSRTQLAPVVIDCQGARHAPATSAEVNEAGAVTAADWTQAEPDDPLITAACRED